MYIWYRGRGADCLKTYTNQEKQWQWVKGSTQYTWRKYGPYSSAELQNGFIIMAGAVNQDMEYGYLDAVFVTTEASFTPENVLPLQFPGPFSLAISEPGIHTFPVRLMVNDELVAETTYQLRFSKIGSCLFQPLTAFL